MFLKLKSKYSRIRPICTTGSKIEIVRIIMWCYLNYLMWCTNLSEKMFYCTCEQISKLTQSILNFKLNFKKKFFIFLNFPKSLNSKILKLNYRFNQFFKIINKIIKTSANICKNDLTLSENVINLFQFVKISFDNKTLYKFLFFTNVSIVL